MSFYFQDCRNRRKSKEIIRPCKTTSNQAKWSSRSLRRSRADEKEQENRGTWWKTASGSQEEKEEYVLQFIYKSFRLDCMAVLSKKPNLREDYFNDADLSILNNSSIHV